MSERQHEVAAVAPAGGDDDPDGTGSAGSTPAAAAADARARPVHKRRHHRRKTLEAQQQQQPQQGQEPTKQAEQEQRAMPPPELLFPSACGQLSRMPPASIQRAGEDPMRMSTSLLPDASALAAEQQPQAPEQRAPALLGRPSRRRGWPTQSAPEAQQSPGQFMSISTRTAFTTSTNTALSPTANPAAQAPAAGAARGSAEHALAQQSLLSRSMSFTAPLVRTASSQSSRSTEKHRVRPKNLSNRFLVGNIIGRGSYAKVRDAYDVHYKTVVAVKIFKWAQLKRIPGGDVSLKRELTALRKVTRHPNVVSLVDFWRDPAQGKSYVALDYMPCGTLEGLLAACGGRPLPLEQARLLFSGLAAGLAHMHGCGVFHRDIKPDNLMLVDNTHLCLSDFGTATTERAAEGIGAPAFQPPEVAADGRTLYADKLDVWAAGITLYIMVVGEYPYPAHKSLFQTFQLISTTDVAVPTSLPPPLQDLLHGMLERDPERRLGTAEVAQHPWVVTPSSAADGRSAFVAVEPRGTIFTPDSIARFVKELLPQHAAAAEQPQEQQQQQQQQRQQEQPAKQEEQEAQQPRKAARGHINEKTDEFVPHGGAARSCSKTGCTVQ